MSDLTRIDQELINMSVMSGYLIDNITSLSPMLQVKFLEATLKFASNIKPLYIAASMELNGKE